ncbi:hypothetical protein DEU56DRAFT_761251 [Suillus clintonianus]|uniref:uncharacterized protein n=1 Tax=Suillus clintonianus TaxID=1904413 RepID=UPI001B880F26|nr:uncharacterized protein DEU56DRAFT_761251 [Suillus clintonianus]KAG2118369.1 hypothetical protein DEU56DRAFT_761251 [Suillus clintonianus]
MAQGNPSRKKRFSFFGKTRSEASGSDPSSPGQSRGGHFASFSSKAKDLVTRRAGQPKPSQQNSPSAEATENSAQLTATKEGANELQDTSANHPNVSLKDPPPDGNRNMSTSEQRAQLHPNKLPEADKSMNEGQAVHSAELNNSDTKVTNMPDSDKVTTHFVEPNDSAIHADSKPDSEGVDAARLLARQEVAGLKPIFGPVQAVASSINDTGDPIAAVDYVTPLLGTVSKFNDIVAKIAEIHPYTKAAWGVLSVVPKVPIYVHQYYHFSDNSRRVSPATPLKNG